MTMAGRTVELTVAGESCRVVTTADESELRRLAAMVEDRLAGVWQPGRPVKKGSGTANSGGARPLFH